MRSVAPYALACSLMLAGCSGAERTIVTGEEEVAAAVKSQGGSIVEVLGEREETVVALLTRRQRSNLESEHLDVLHIGAVTRRVSLADGTPVIDYRMGDLNRTEGEAPPPEAGGTLVYILDGGTSGPSDHTGPQMHPEKGHSCTRHGDLVHTIVRHSTQGREVRTVDVKVLCTKVDREAVLHAIHWIAANHPEGTRGVVNASFTLPDGPDLHLAIEALRARDIAVVWAAGNRSRDVCDGRQVPLHPHVLVVGSATGGEADPVSNHGECVDLWAAGSYKEGCDSEGMCMIRQGTSIAAPRVAAMLANLWEAAPHLSSAQLVDLLTASAGPSGRFGPWTAAEASTQR